MISIKKDVKKMAFAGIGLAVLVAATSVVLILQKIDDDEKARIEAEEKELKEAEAAKLAFTTFTSENIVKVSVKNSNDEYTIEEIDLTNDKYTVEGVTNVLLNTETLRPAINYLANIKADQIVEEDAADLSKYGLDKPVSEIEIFLKDGTSDIILVGNEAPSDLSTYAKKKDSNKVFIIPSYKVSRHLDSRLSFIAVKDILAPYETGVSPEVNRLSITQSGEEPIIINLSEVTPEGRPIKGVHTHAFENPVGVGIDPTKGEKLVYGMYGICALETVGYGKDAVGADYAGLSDPSYTIEMTADETYTLTLGSPVFDTVESEDGTKSEVLRGYYGVLDKYPDVLYIFSTDYLPWLNIDYEDIMTRLFLLPSIYIVSEIVVESGEYQLSLISEGDSTNPAFKINGKTTDNETGFKEFYQYLISASAENIYKGQELGELAARFTYKYRSEDLTEDVIEFYYSSDLKVNICVNGEPLYRIKENYVLRLKQNIEALLNGEKIIISW